MHGDVALLKVSKLFTGPRFASCPDSRAIRPGNFPSIVVIRLLGGGKKEGTRVYVCVPVSRDILIVAIRDPSQHRVSYRAFSYA